MFELIIGAWVAQAIQVAAELGIADALTEKPLPLDDLADRVGAESRCPQATDAGIDQPWHIPPAPRRPL